VPETQQDGVTQGDINLRQIQELQDGCFIIQSYQMYFSGSRAHRFEFKPLQPRWANYGPRATYGPLRCLIQPVGRLGHIRTRTYNQ